MLDYFALLSSITSAFFITIAPAPCSSVFSAECALRTCSRLPSSPLRYPPPAFAATLSVRSLSAGRPVRNLVLRAEPVRAFPPTIVPSYASPAPYRKAYMKVLA